MLLIHEGRREARGSSGLGLSLLARLNMAGRLLGWALPVTVWGDGVLGRAGSVFCLGCDSDGGVTWAGTAFFTASGDGRRWAANSLLVGSGDLVSFATEEMDAACFRCWFSGQVSIQLVSCDGAARVWVDMAVVLAVRLPLLGVCSQETSTPWTWSMVAVEWDDMGW